MVSLLTASVSCPPFPSVYQRILEALQLNETQNNFSLYSLYRLRTMFCSIIRNSGWPPKVLANSGLFSNTQYGPRNRTMNRLVLLGPLIPALDRIMASVTFITLQSCPMTRLCFLQFLFQTKDFCFYHPSSQFCYREYRSHLEILLAISSSVTLSCFLEIKS